VYYVRLPSGDEKTYRTVEEMVWDVELGVINREAMIFHPATKAWVQVTRHPQLGSRFVSEDGSTEEVGLDFDLLSDDEIKGMEPKVPEPLAPPMADLVINTDIAIDTAEQMASAPEVKPAEGLAIAGEFLTLKEPIPSLLTPEPPPPANPPTRPPAAPGGRTPLPSPASYLPEPLPIDGELAPLPEEGLDSSEYKPLEWKPEPRFRGLALIAGAVGLVLLVATGAWFGWQWWANRPSAVRQAGVEIDTTPGDTAVARQAIDSLSDRELAAAIATLAAAETAGTGVRPPPRPGRLIAGSAQPRAVEGLRPMTPIELRRSYAAAYANARSAVDSDLALGGVSRLFSNARLTSRDSLRAGRRLVTSARNIVRVYHSDEVQIERAYRDTVNFQVSRMGWSKSQQADWKARATLKESYEGSELTDSLLTYTDDLYTLLLGHWGEYEISGNSISFDDPAVADEYQALATWLQSHITQLDSESDNSSSSPTSRRIARALGGTRPPTLRRSRVPD
jgi:hypothetical protein